MEKINLDNNLTNLQNSLNKYPKNFMDITNIKEVVKKIKEKDHSLAVFLKTSYLLDKNIIACDYAFHKNVLERDENKSIIEKIMSEIYGEKISMKFIIFNDDTRLKYKEVLEEQTKREEIESKKWREENKERLEKEEREFQEKEYSRLKKENKERIDRDIGYRIPPKFKSADLKNSLKITQDYCEQRKYLEKGLFLFGSFGTGKTYNVYALAKFLIEKDVNVWVYNLPRLLNTIRASFSKQEVYNEDTDNYSYAFVKDMGDIEKLIDVEILAIDDIGAEKPSDWVAETLYYLINSRYENMKTTIFTSNLSLDKLADRIGDRIVSRIAEMCDVYEVKGEDRRIKT